MEWPRGKTTSTTCVTVNTEININTHDHRIISINLLQPTSPEPEDRSDDPEGWPHFAHVALSLTNDKPEDDPEDDHRTDKTYHML